MSLPYLHNKWENIVQNMNNITVYSENLAMLIFFSIGAYPVANGSLANAPNGWPPIWASVALATPTTKQLKTHVAGVKVTTSVSTYITYMRRDMLKFYVAV